MEKIKLTKEQKKKLLEAIYFTRANHLQVVHGKYRDYGQAKVHENRINGLDLPYNCFLCEWVQHYTGEEIRIIGTESIYHDGKYDMEEKQKYPCSKCLWNLFHGVFCHWLEGDSVLRYSLSEFSVLRLNLWEKEIRKWKTID